MATEDVAPPVQPRAVENEQQVVPQAQEVQNPVQEKEAEPLEQQAEQDSQRASVDPMAALLELSAAADVLRSLTGFGGEEEVAPKPSEAVAPQPVAMAQHPVPQAPARLQG